MDDIISRKKLLRHLSDWQMGEAGRSEAVYTTLDNVIEAVNNMPSAERKKGRWIRHILKKAKVPWGFDCSECGTWFVIGEDTAEGYNYCPNCGAEMRGEEDGSD